jgi:hypothetical protein
MNPTLALLIWLGASLLIGLAGSIAVRARALERSAWGGVGGEVALFVFHVGLPFAALISGALSLDLLGLGTDWFDAGQVAGFEPSAWLRGLGAAALATAFVLAVLWFAWRATPDEAGGRIPAAIAIRNAIYDEVHWAFYRSPFILLLTDAYLGTLVGCVVVLGERLAQRRLAGIGPAPRSDDLIWISCLLTSSVLYLATQNLWLMIGADIVIRLVAARLWQARVYAGQR